MWQQGAVSDKGKPWLGTADLGPGRETELRSQAPQEPKRLAGEKQMLTVLTATEADMQLSALAHGLNLLDYLWEEKENTSEREYVDLLFMSYMKAWLFENAGVSHLHPPWPLPQYRVAKGSCSLEWSRVSQSCWFQNVKVEE